MDHVAHLYDIIAVGIVLLVLAAFVTQDKRRSRWLLIIALILFVGGIVAW